MANNKFKESKIPNPYGKLGSPAHREEVDNLAKKINSRGLRAFEEFLIFLISGKKKFIDVAGLENGQVVEFHQIGKQTKKGLPVKRERDTLDKIEESFGIRPEFHPYNKRRE